MKGKYIILEGGEGVGKTTQAELLIQALAAQGQEAVYVQEPGSTPFAIGLRELIKSPIERSSKTNVLAFNAARAETMIQIESILATGRWVISDRSWLSTIVYQCYGEGQDLETVRSVCEYAVTVKPDLVLVLDASAESVAPRLEKRGGTDYFEDLATEFHERVRQGYLEEAHRAGFPIIDAGTGVSAVSEAIDGFIKQLVSGEKIKQSESNPYLDKSKDLTEVTPAGKKWLSEVLSNTDDNVYVFNENISPITVAAAMARLSRRADDMRITLLDEFSRKKGKDEELLKRVITAYGDDSVQQLTGIHAVVENASNLLTKKLEWGRLAAYLEQSTRYIYYDNKDKNGKYRYYTPRELDQKTAKSYQKTIDKIFDLYSEVVRKLTDYIRSNDKTPEKERDIAWKGATRAQACDAARLMLPVATASTVGIYASGQAFESLIMHLLSDELLESRDTGQKLLNEGRTVISTFLERADKPDRGGAAQAYRANTRNELSQLVAKHLPTTNTPKNNQEVELVSVSMANELDLVPYMLYEQSDLSLSELQAEVKKWRYEQKLEVFNAYMGERLNRRHKPGRALEHIEYHWDLVCDYGIFRDLQRHRMVEGLVWQDLTPRFGYEVPKLIEDANLAEQFEKAFDLSFELYSSLQSDGLHKVAQYATLMGHKVRWKISYNARQAFHFHELRTTPQGHPGYRKIVKAMHDKLAEKHPILASHMKFVNQDEDAELTRLAAERYTQYKLEQLDQ